MKWIIEGAQKAIHDHYRLKMPQCVQAAIAKYKADNDWMSHFMEECCETGEGLREESGELFSAYRAFCVRTNDYCRGTAEFYSALEQRGFNRQRTREGRYVLGLRLLDEQL